MRREQLSFARVAVAGAQEERRQEGRSAPPALPAEGGPVCEKYNCDFNMVSISLSAALTGPRSPRAPEPEERTRADLINSHLCAAHKDSSHYKIILILPSDRRRPSNSARLCVIDFYSKPAELIRAR